MRSLTQAFCRLEAARSRSLHFAPARISANSVVESVPVIDNLEHDVPGPTVLLDHVNDDLDLVGLTVLRGVGQCLLDDPLDR